MRTTDVWGRLQTHSPGYQITSNRCPVEEGNLRLRVSLCSLTVEEQGTKSHSVFFFSEIEKAVVSIWAETVDGL